MRTFTFIRPGYGDEAFRIRARFVDEAMEGALRRLGFNVMVLEAELLHRICHGSDASLPPRDEYLEMLPFGVTPPHDDSKYILVSLNQTEPALLDVMDRASALSQAVTLLGLEMKSAMPEEEETVGE
jgi:hypothetical protein